jgi:hypothetical protein
MVALDIALTSLRNKKAFEKKKEQFLLLMSLMSSPRVYRTAHRALCCDVLDPANHEAHGRGAGGILNTGGSVTCMTSVAD